MNYQKIEQKSAEWWAVKVGKISGTRFGQLISTRDNSLIFELVNEKLDGYIEQDDYQNEDMQFGNENEPIAIDLYEQSTGITFDRGGVILSDFSDIHMASPDAVNVERGIVLEVKSTMHGKNQIKRFVNGIDPEYVSQVVNYFACSDAVKSVHWVSYCPFRKERPLVTYIFTRDSVIKKATSRTKEQTVNDLVEIGRTELKNIESEIKKVTELFTQIEF
jgi:predicted phage-related endonuclease